MSIKQKMKILCLISHPDDAELMAGGTIARWAQQGHKIYILTFTDGVWTSPRGVVMRNAGRAL